MLSPIRIGEQAHAGLCTGRLWNTGVQGEKSAYWALSWVAGLPWPCKMRRSAILPFCIGCKFSQAGHSTTHQAAQKARQLFCQSWREQEGFCVWFVKVSSTAQAALDVQRPSRSLTDQAAAMQAISWTALTSKPSSCAVLWSRSPTLPKSAYGAAKIEMRPQAGQPV